MQAAAPWQSWTLITECRLTTASFARLSAPDPDQAAFTNHARFALDNLAAITTRTNQIKLFRQTILNLAVRGRLVPQDPNDEPAAELLKRIAENKARLVKAGHIKKAEAVADLTDSDHGLPTPHGWALTNLSLFAFPLRTATTFRRQKPKLVSRS
jgi:type I restriction enzyme, S subunit